MKLPRADDFIKALSLAREKLPAFDPTAICRNGGAELLPRDGGQTIVLPFFGRPVTITYPEGRVAAASGEDTLSLQEQGLILHYLLGVRDIPLTNELITFREIPSGEFYYQPFLKRAKVPLVNVFGLQHELFRRAGEKLAGRDGTIGDNSLTFLPFPKIPITLVLWKGDDEFPPEGNVLFDSSIKHFLAGEDIAFLAGIAVYKLIALAKN